MDKIIKNVLKVIIDAGYEAYVVGGYTRDYLLGIKTNDIDICTNALPKDLHKLFPVNNNSNDYGGFNLKIKNYNIDITTYRKEIKYEGRKPTEIIYLNDLESDLKRRDFTINAVCLDYNEKIIDYLGGISDITNHKIKMIGDCETKIQEDPLRILRAIRFASILNFDLDATLDKEIKKNYKLVLTLSNIRIKEEITKILLNKNYQKGLNLLKKYHILDILNIKYDDVNYVNDICGMWAQLDFSFTESFTKQEIRNIINIRNILEKGEINNQILYEYGLYTSLVAAEILNINKKTVNNLYKKLDLKTEKDLDIKSEDIMQVLNIKPSPKLREIKEELITLILEGKLENKKKSLINYLQRKE